LPTGPAGVPSTVELTVPPSQEAETLLAATRPPRALKLVTCALDCPPPARTVAEPIVMVPSDELALPDAVLTCPSVLVTDGVVLIGDEPVASIPYAASWNVVAARAGPSASVSAATATAPAAAPAAARVILLRACTLCSSPLG